MRQPSQYGVIDFAPDGWVREIVEKPSVRLPTMPLLDSYFYDEEVADIAATLTPSARGELEISNLNNRYFAPGASRTGTARAGFAWLDTRTPESLLRAAEFVATTEARQRPKIACPEEIAWRQNWIDDAQLDALAAKFKAIPTVATLWIWHKPAAKPLPSKSNRVPGSSRVVV